MSIPPVTPPRDSPAVNASAISLQSTPLSRGAGSHNSYDTETSWVHYYPYLDNDTKDAPQIEFDKFVELVWNTNLADFYPATKRVIEDKSYKRLLEGYCKEVSGETDHYHPFVNLANHILALSNHSHLTFVRNDLSILWG
jgi:hypothetical protein